jgi:hypothetical protein
MPESLEKSCFFFSFIMCGNLLIGGFREALNLIRKKVIHQSLNSGGSGNNKKDRLRESVFDAEYI